MLKTFSLFTLLALATPLSASNNAIISATKPLDASHYISLLGAPYGTKGIQAIRQRFSAERPEMDYEDARAHWYFYETAGVDFVFADEAIFTDNEAMDIGEGDIFLTGVDFYDALPCEYFRDLHQLPFGVKYGDDYDRVVARLEKAGGKHKLIDRKGDNLFAFKRKDGARYVVIVTFTDGVGMTALRIRLNHGQDYLLNMGA